jgi:TetR/AcrR family transcriptional regulator of autoinduction and epiphytic fitness
VHLLGSLALGSYATYLSRYATTLYHKFTHSLSLTMSADTEETGTLDPRIERSRLLVRQAALAEFGERGWGGLTIEAVAARAGVARSTIYRHWPDKLALITDALEVLNQQPLPRPDGETPRTRVQTLLAHLATAVTDSALWSCVPALIDAAEHSPEVREFHHRYNAERRRALVEAIALGIDGGDFPPATEPELAAQSLAGAIFYRRLMTSESFDPDRVDELVDLVLGPPA